MTTFLSVKNNAVSSLAGAILIDDLSLDVQPGHGGKFPDTFPFNVTVDVKGVNEIVQVGARSGDTLSSLIRAQEGTSAAGHPSGKTVELLITEKQIQDIHNAINALESDYLPRDGSLPLTDDWNPGVHVIGDYDWWARPRAMQVGDEDFALTVVSGIVYVWFDTSSILRYDRANEKFHFLIGGTIVAEINSQGIAMPLVFYIPFGSDESYAP